MSNINQYGASYKFGFDSNDAPSLGGQIFIRSAELRYEAEVFAQAQDGEGSTEAVATTQAAKRKITGTFTGYISTSFNPASVPATFQFGNPPRNFIVRNVSQAKRKGEFNEATVEGESYYLIP